jgi:argininosuccinate lyase
MTMWGGRFSEGPSALLRALNDSLAYDRELLAEDIAGSIAWARELGASGVLPHGEVDSLVAALEEIRELPIPTEGELPEDVHSWVEDQLRARLGDLGGKLHTGRSRNDQVATDLRLWLKNACDDASALTGSLVRVLAQRALEESATPMPGYTHLKQAEPVTFGHWCMAYVAMLERDLSRFADAKQRGDECPLGSGALAGTPLSIDRERLAKSLGFARATANSLDAVSDRDFAAEYLFASTTLLSHLSRLAEDLIFMTSDEAAYAVLPDSMATGSSRMPHKKNPDVLELSRGYAARALGELTGFLALLKGLPLAYNKDLQLDKEPLFRLRGTLALILPAVTALVAGLELDRDRMLAAASSDLLMATDAADELAATGMSFRQAHEMVGREGRRSTSSIATVLAKKGSVGGTSPERVREAAALALARNGGAAKVES